MALYKRGSIYWADVYRNGVRVRQSTHTADRRKAQKIHDDLASESHRRPRGQRHLSDALDLWRAARPRSARDESMLKIIAGYYPDRDLADVTTASVQQVFGAMAPGTHNRYLSVIRYALRLAMRQGWMSEMPELRDKPGAREKTRWLSQEEWQRLRSHLGGTHRTLAEISLATGLRLANCRLLEWRHVHLARRQIILPPEVVKNRKPLMVPLSAQALQVLSAQRGRHKVWVVPGDRSGGPVGDFTRTIQPAVAAAGLDADVTFHTLRHTWASWHALNGTPLQVLQQLGGWSQIRMVMRYAHLSPDHVASWADNGTAPVTKSLETRAA